MNTKLDFPRTDLYTIFVFTFTQCKHLCQLKWAYVLTNMFPRRWIVRKFFTLPCGIRFSVAKEGNDYYGSFYFLVDEVKYAYEDEYTGSNSTPTGTATINIELTAGQIVRVENRGSSKIGGTDSTGIMLSWFTGHLLYPL